MIFYLRKIGGHLQELAILAVIFVPLERRLTKGEAVVLCLTCAIMALVGIEMERRFSE